MRMMTARELALKALGRYEPQKSNLTLILNSCLKTAPAAFKEHGFVRDLVWGTVRRLNTLDFVIDRYCKKTEPVVRDILRLGLQQLLYMPDIPDYAAVDETVKLAAAAKKRSASGLINAVLRGVIRDRENIFDSARARNIAERIAVIESHPEWLVRRWLGRYGEEGTESMCRANNAVPGLVIRPNLSRTTREALLDKFRAAAVETEPARYAPGGIRLLSNPELERLESFKAGEFVVQDEASQLVSLILGPRPGESILDLCSGAGIKTSHIAELAGGGSGITAVDISSEQIDRAKMNLGRLGVEGVKAVKEDAAKFNGPAFDKILVDAPCSGLGTIRRKPDIKWNRAPADIAQKYPGMQSRILDNAAKLLKPGGIMVYCTCTTEPEENEGVVESFLSARSGFAVEPAFKEGAAADLVEQKSGYFRTSVQRHGLDAFFAAKIRKAP